MCESVWMGQQHLLFRILHSLKFVKAARLLDCDAAMAFAA